MYHPLLQLYRATPSIGHLRHQGPHVNDMLDLRVGLVANRLRIRTSAAKAHCNSKNTTANGFPFQSLGNTCKRVNVGLGRNRGLSLRWNERDELELPLEETLSYNPIPRCYPTRVSGVQNN